MSRQMLKPGFTSIFFITLLIISFFAGIFPISLALSDLTIDFVEIGKNGVLSPRSPEIQLSVTDSSEHFVSGVTITIVNPLHCYNYDWTVTESAPYYLVTANSFPQEAIKDDFTFTFERTGYNSETVNVELAINAPSITFTDEHGNAITDSNIQFNMESLPSKTQVSSQFQTVFVDSSKYFVTRYAYQSEFSWEEGLCYIVIDENHDLVTDGEICNESILTYLVGPYFAQSLSPEDLNQLSAWAQDIINYGGSAYVLAELRDFFAQFAGFLIAGWLGSAAGQISQAATVSQKIIVNANNIREKWFDFMTVRSPPYFEMSVKVTEMLLVINAMDRLHIAGNMFLSLSDDIQSYRGTTRFDYSEVNGLYEQWVDACHELLVAIDVLENMLPPPDLWSQVFDIAVNMVSGFTGFPAAEILATPNVAGYLANSLSKYAAMEDEFYEWLKLREDASALLRQKIQNTGHTRIIIPYPGPDDFQLLAYHASTQLTSATIFAGASATFTVDVELISGAVSEVSLSLSGQDGTMSADFTPQTAQPSFTSTLTITTSPSSSGRFALTVSGSSGDLTRVCQIVLEVLNPPPPQGAISVDPLNSATGTVMYGAYTRYHGRVDPYYNGREVWIAQSVDGGSLFYLVGQYIPTSNNEWYYPSSMTVVPIWLSAWLGVELPCTYLMKAGIHGTVLESNTVSFTMVKATTSTEVYVTSDSIVEDETVTITGTIFSSLGISGSPYACSETWYIDWRQENGDWNVLASGSVNAEFSIPPDGGPYCILFNIPAQIWTPPTTGTYGLRARYSGDNNYEASTSDEKTLIVEPNTYLVTVSIDGLPSSNSTNIYIDNVHVDTLNGGESNTYTVGVDSLHTLSVDPQIDLNPNTRFLSSIKSVILTGPTSYAFNYHEQYKLTVEVLPPQTGRVGLTGSMWFDSNTTVEAKAIPNATYTFNYWEIDGMTAGSSENMSLVMNTSHTLRAFFKITGDVDGDGAVDASDLGDLSIAYGSHSSKSNWNPDCDLNNDRKIDALDLFNLGRNYGRILENILFEDDFEAYAVDMFPSAGGWELVWDGQGPQYQLVTDVVSYSPTRSLQLWGKSGNSANVQNKFTSNGDTIGYEVYIRTDNLTGTAHQVAQVCFWNRSGLPAGKKFARIDFLNTGEVNMCPVSGVSGVFVQTFEPNRWYKVWTVVDKATGTFDVWIDDVPVVQDEDIWDIHEIEALQLQCGHAEVKAYFDDVKVFEGS